jgi:GntR family transcriptional regulator, rspAB operon transcriptional repressor
MLSLSEPPLALAGPIRPSLVREEVYSRLKREILSGQLGGGTRLGEIALAERLGVSRTPVREAVQRLAQDGLVEVLPNRGARVRLLAASEVEHTYTVRATLDGLAARLAASRPATERAAQVLLLQAALARLEAADPNDWQQQTQADLAFHQAIAQASANPVLENTLQGLAESVARVKLLTQSLNQTPETAQDHRAIVAAIEQGQAGEAERQARAHVERFQAIVLGQFLNTNSNSENNSENNSASNNNSGDRSLT